MYELAIYAVIPVLIGLAVSIAVPFVTKAAKGLGVTGSKDKLSVNNAVDFVKGYQLQLDQEKRENDVKQLMSNPNALLAIGVASFFFLYQFLKRK